MRTVFGVAATACLIMLSVPGMAGDATKAEPHGDTRPAGAPAIPPAGGPMAEAASGDATAATLQRLNNQAAILEVTARIAKARKEIADAEKGTAATGAGVPAMPAPPGLLGSVAPGAGELPSVLVISGSGRNLAAEIALPAGGVAVVRMGSVLRDVGRVASISASGVSVVAEGGEHITLPFRSEGASQPSFVRPSPLPGAVPLPPRPMAPAWVAGSR